MCLCPNTQGKTAVLQKFKKQRRPVITFYKVLDRDGKQLKSELFDKTWKRGINYAYNYNKKKVKIDDIEINPIFGNKEISFGIHVYTQKPIIYYDKDKVVVPVKCHKDDLMGAASGHAVFTKVELLQKDYDKITKE